MQAKHKELERLIDAFEKNFQLEDFTEAATTFENIDRLLKSFSTEDTLSYQWQLSDIVDKIVEYTNRVHLEQKKLKSKIVDIRSKDSKVSKYKKIRSY